MSCRWTTSPSRSGKRPPGRSGTTLPVTWRVARSWSSSPARCRTSRVGTRAGATLAPALEASARGYSRERTGKPKVSLIAQVHKSALGACGLRERRTDPDLYVGSLLRCHSPVRLRRLYRVAVGAIDLLLDVRRLRGRRIRVEARRSREPLPDRGPAAGEGAALRQARRVDPGLRVHRDRGRDRLFSVVGDRRGGEDLPHRVERAADLPLSHRAAGHDAYRASIPRHSGRDFSADNLRTNRRPPAG